MAIFYDTHAHLDYPEYAADLPQVLERAEAAGITRVISIGTDLESSRRAIKLSEQLPAVFAAIGWHPTNVIEAPEDLRPALRELAGHPRVVAIGETGLDYHHLPAAEGRGPGSIQAKAGGIFRQQMEVAAEFGLNCVIHQRDALADTLAQMEPFGRIRGYFIASWTTRKPCGGFWRWVRWSASRGSRPSKTAKRAGHHRGDAVGPVDA